MNDPSPAGFSIRPRVAADDDAWLAMRLELWPEGDADDHRAGMREWLAEPTHIILIAERVADGARVGFAEVGTRPYAEGCESSPVAYLEGWFVDASARQRGVGAALVRAAEAWARAHGYREFASDALLDNDISHAAHRAIGFEEVCRTVSYRKLL